MTRIGATEEENTGDTGLAADPCSPQNGCLAPRKCVFYKVKKQDGANVLGETLNCTAEHVPFCLCSHLENAKECSRSSNCKDSEKCLLVKDIGFPSACYSPLVADYFPNFVEYNRPPGSGLEYDHCENTADCKEPRDCSIVLNPNNSTLTPCGAALGCRCFREKPAVCEKDSDCDELAGDNGEVCRYLVFNRTAPDGSGVAPKQCYSKRVADSDPTFFKELPADVLKRISPTPTPRIKEPVRTQSPREPSGSENDSGCIAVKHLPDLVGRQLVYAKDMERPVLCDRSGSCATTGHMVVWKGNAMMMRSYCELVGCEERVMWVNSPTWGPAVRVESSTDDLEFTAFAARWGSSMEESALRVVLRAGL